MMNTVVASDLSEHSGVAHKVQHFDFALIFFHSCPAAEAVDVLCRREDLICFISFIIPPDIICRPTPLWRLDRMCAPLKRAFSFCRRRHCSMLDSCGSSVNHEQVCSRSILNRSLVTRSLLRYQSPVVGACTLAGQSLCALPPTADVIAPAATFGLVITTFVFYIARNMTENGCAGFGET
jgi:hypothetical protein